MFSFLLHQALVKLKNKFNVVGFMFLIISVFELNSYNWQSRLKRLKKANLSTIQRRNKTKFNNSYVLSVFLNIYSAHICLRILSHVQLGWIIH